MIAVVSLLLVCTAADTSSEGTQILSQRCVRCHNADKSRGGLDLSTRETALAGGATMEALVPGDLAKSGIYLRAKDHSMPPPKDAPPLSEEELNALARWITAGASWPPPRQQSPPPQPGICAVDSQSRPLRRWRRYGNVAPPLPQVALRPRRR